MWTFIRYEWKYWLRSPMIWIFLLINTLLVMGAVSSDEINIGGGVGSVHKNAPYVIQTYYGVMSLICLLMTTAFMNATAIRDFQSGMYQFVFTSPIQKYNYFFGKFIGAATIAVIPLLGVSIGALIGPVMPWAQPERYGPIIWNGHLWGILAFGIPNVIISGVLLYALAIKFRSSTVSFVGAMLLIVAYSISSGFVDDIETEWISNLVDPFGFRPQGIAAKYLTVDEKNAAAIPLQGAFLFNRLIWIVLSFGILLFLYFRFSFSAPKEKRKRNPKNDISASPATTPVTAYRSQYTPQNHAFSWVTLWRLTKFETTSIVRNPTFITIVLIGLINLIINLTSFTSNYGSQQYPVTYDIISAIKGSFYLFIIGVITFYSGVLVWKERDAHIHEIEDATPVQSGTRFVSKLLAMLFALELIMISSILVGVISQTLHGYFRYELHVYFWSLMVMDTLTFWMYVILALFFHYLINNRYIAYFAFVAFIVLNTFIWNAFDVSSNMVSFAATPYLEYSDMNGFGPFVGGQFWFTTYWLLCCIVLCLIIRAFYVRGKELQFRSRLKHAKTILAEQKWKLTFAITAFVLCGVWVFYNTKVLNKYETEDQNEQNQIDYEKTFQRYANLPQPRFVKLEYELDIDPQNRNLIADIELYVRNPHATPIQEIHFNMPSLSDSVEFMIPGASLALRDDRLAYRIYKLQQPLNPGDTLQFHIRNTCITRGFENAVSFTQLTQNGTFFNNQDICPSIGYQRDKELSNKNDRIKYELPARIRMPQLNEADSAARRNTYITNDADWVSIKTIIKTAPDQLAVAPGSLVKEWTENNKRCFEYILEQPSLNFYSFISAKYEVARKKWKNIDLEVYYIPEHSYNVDNMIRSMEKSLDYYTTHFGPYKHKQCRIIEFPRYSSFAQAFPGTMPYSEGIGFITDLREVTKDDIDVVFYVVAHEMGHQYWAHQVSGANMQGSEWLSEGFAQYSALMVMEKEYGKDKMQKFLRYEMNDYLQGRSGEYEAERPLMRTENQGYLHYNKASVVMYYLKEMIGEQNVNAALKSLVDSFGYKQPPYPTSYAALRAFQRVTPDSIRYVLTDCFETITLLSNRVVETSYQKTAAGYEVTIRTQSEKFRSDSLGTETNQPLADFIDIGVFAKPENDKNLGKPLVMQRLHLKQKENTFTFTVPEEPYQAGIDPYNYLVDRIPSDNIKKVSEQN